MSETPKVGDKVRYIVEGHVTAVGDYLTRIEQGNFAGGVSVNHDGDHGRFEILERADDPARDPVGTVRRFGDDTVTIVWIKTDRDAWTRTPSQGLRSTWRDFAMSDSSIIGSVTGTPAAKAAAPAEPEYEYYRGQPNPCTYRLKGDSVEYYNRGIGWTDSRCTPSDIRRYWVKLDGKPSDVAEEAPVEITAESPEPDRSKTYRDVQGDLWRYEGGWRFFDSSSDHVSSTYPWRSVVSVFSLEFPWHLADVPSQSDGREPTAPRSADGE